MSRNTYFVQECPTCGRNLQVRVQYLGKQVVCQHCSARFEACDPSSAGYPPPLQPVAAGTGRAIAANGRRRIGSLDGDRVVPSDRRSPGRGQSSAAYYCGPAPPGRRRTADTFFRRSSGCRFARPVSASPPARNSSPCGGRCTFRSSRLSAASVRGSIVRPSSCSITSTPSFRNSVATAAMRSVSLWRMWATLRIVVGPSANSATTASVCTVSLIAFMSTSMPRSARPMTVMRIRIAPHLAAHLFQAVDERHVALQAVCRQAFDGHFAAGDRGRRPEITCGRGVRLDRILARTVALRRGNREIAANPRLFPLRRRTTASRRASCAHTAAKRAARRSPVRHGALRSRRGHQQAAEKLARDVAANRCRAAGQAVRMHDHRRAAVAVLAGGMRAQLIERLEQIADRPLAHPLDAVEPKRAVAECRERGQKPDRRAAVGTEQLGFQRGNLAARPVDDQRACRTSCDSTSMPSRPSPSIITRVSSLSSAPVSVETPSANAAQTRARFVMLFDPGGRTRPRIGPATGLISSGSVMRRRGRFSDRVLRIHAKISYDSL